MAFDQDCPHLASREGELQMPCVPLGIAGARTFTDVLTAVERADDLTDGVRSNITAAVRRAAGLVSAVGLSGSIDVPKLARVLGALTPAKLGMASPGSLAAFKSNLRRGMRLAGIDVMPGRHVTPLAPDWDDLLASLETPGERIKLSRLAHVASEHGWKVREFTAGHMERFRDALATTNLNSKSDRIVRDAITTWRAAAQKLAWVPPIDFAAPSAGDRVYIVPWDQFPEGLRRDVEAFVARHPTDPDDILGLDLDFDVPDRLGAPRRIKDVLKPRTQENYRDAFRRMASILVRLGRTPETLTDIGALITRANVKAVLEYLTRRTGRREGGLIGYVAFLAFFAARDHLLMDGRELAWFVHAWKNVRGPRDTMSPRSLRRLRQFDDPNRTLQMARLPAILAAEAERFGAADERGVKLMRTAVYVAIGLDATLRSGNIVAIELDRHLKLTQNGKQWVGHLDIPNEEVKNGEAVTARLIPETVTLIRRWIDAYRPSDPSSGSTHPRYLFPARGGTHLSVNHACQCFKDVAGRYVGVDATPHGMRSFVGKVVLDANPEAYSTVQQILGHKSLKTTIAYYAPYEPDKARQRAQECLLRVRSGPRTH